MTTEEWKKLQDERFRFKNIRIASKRIENALRYIVFSYYSTEGRDKALEKLDSLVGNASFVEKITEKNVNNIKVGIKGELIFFDSFRDRFHLVPTLDAGCLFDFIGMIDDGDQLRNSFGGRFVRIDVTTNIEEKKKREVVSCFGQKQWPYVFAHVRINDKKLDFYDEKFGSIGGSQPLNCSAGAVYDGTSKVLNVRYQCVRRELLEFIQTHERATIHDCSFLNEVSDKLCAEQKKKLFAQAVFFLQYGYALNIVPALEMGEFTDFIGEHDGELVRYMILISLNDYYEKIRSSIEKLSHMVQYKYKIALYDEGTKTFKFFDGNDCNLFNDIPEDFGEE